MTFSGEGARPAARRRRRRLGVARGEGAFSRGARIPLLGGGGGGGGEREGGEEPLPDPRSSGAAGELWLLIVSRRRGAGPARGAGARTAGALGLRMRGTLRVRSEVQRGPGGRGKVTGAGVVGAGGTARGALGAGAGAGAHRAALRP